MHQTATGAALDRTSGLASGLAMIAQTMAEDETQVLHMLVQACIQRAAGRLGRTGAEWPPDYISVELEQAG